jgi:hypothetical protein
MYALSHNQSEKLFVLIQNGNRSPPSNVVSVLLYEEPKTTTTTTTTTSTTTTTTTTTSTTTATTTTTTAFASTTTKGSSQDSIASTFPVPVLSVRFPALRWTSTDGGVSKVVPEMNDRHDEEVSKVAEVLKPGKYNDTFAEAIVDAAGV